MLLNLKKSSKYTLFMNLLPKRPKYANMHRKKYYYLEPLSYKTNICSAGSDGSMSASGSAGPEFDPRRGSKFSTTGLGGGVEMYTF